MTNQPSASRRHFLTISSAAVGSFAVAGAFDSLLGRAACAGEARRTPGYGKLRPVRDETTGLPLLQLPEGFRYRTFGWTRDRMSDGRPTPGVHDGMAVIAADDAGILTLCRNHEIRDAGSAFGGSHLAFDACAKGGCSNLRFDSASGQWLSAVPSLSGTIKNCAGGPTPWGTWLSCEEAVMDPGGVFEGVVYNYRRRHGWIFEVPAAGHTTAIPLRDMGCFVHEAVAVDPDTGTVYETEDRETSGFYRFLPNSPGRLADGGVLEMLKVPGRPDLSKGVDRTMRYPCEWVRIDDPQLRNQHGPLDELGVYKQGVAKGGTNFARLEGCWYGNGLIYFVSTNGGDAAIGQIWSFDPLQQELSLLFESPSSEILESPDNIAVSPRGGIILCEDGILKPQRLHGLTPDGQLFSFAANNMVLRGEKNGFAGDYRDGEWAGACFSPDGRWLFANLQVPGLTMAITGPWADGGL